MRRNIGWLFLFWVAVVWLSTLDCSPTLPQREAPASQDAQASEKIQQETSPENTQQETSPENTQQETSPEKIQQETSTEKSWPPNTPPRCPSPSIQSVPSQLRLDPFYKKYVDAGGIPLIGSDKVPASAFARAYYMIANMLRDKPCIRLALIQSGIRVGLIATSERTTEMPEYRDLNTAFPNVDWDKRARGLGATLVRPLITGAEENILQKSEDPWRGELILLHEFAHTMFDFGIFWRESGDTHQKRLEDLYKEAQTKGLWSNTYAMSTPQEYWAEGVQSWFDNNLESIPANGVHNEINTRVELKQYDPSLHDFIAQFFDGRSWPAYCSIAEDGPTWQDPTPAEPLKAQCTLRKVTLKDLGCAQEGTLQSSPPQGSAKLEIANRDMKKPYTILRVDTQGQAKDVQTLSARRQANLTSYVGEVWLLRDEQGACVGMYQLSHPENTIVMD